MLQQALLCHTLSVAIFLCSIGEKKFERKAGMVSAFSFSFKYFNGSSLCLWFVVCTVKDRRNSENHCKNVH